MPRIDVLAFQRFKESIRRWNALPVGEHVRDLCPFCEALVILQNDVGRTHMAHRLPLCDAWVVALASLGAHSPRESQPGDDLSEGEGEP